MSTRTIAGDIRQIRSLMKLGPDIGSCVIRREDYGELLKLFDSIETKAKRMQDALKPVLECDCWIKRFNNGSIIMDGMEKAIDAITEAKRIYNEGGAK